MPLTLSIDCGGTGLKGSVLDPEGSMVAEPVRVATPYPLPPSRFIAELAAIAGQLPRADRVTVGMPGMIRHGTVVTTPHYITKRGPHSPVDPELERAWQGFDVDEALEGELSLPTLVMNDAEVAGAGAISGFGFEVMFTLGTGLGCAIFDNGVLMPHLELSRAPVRRGRIYDEYVGDKARKRHGRTVWSRRVRESLLGLQPMLQWDELYLGGGNSGKVRESDLKALGPAVAVVPNEVGIIGGVRAWQITQLPSAALVPEEFGPQRSEDELASLLDQILLGGQTPAETDQP